MTGDLRTIGTSLSASSCPAGLAERRSW
jgi:hypothetical protein